MKFFCLIDVFDVCLNCCYRLRILIFASKYQNECDVALLLPLALFFDDVKAEVLLRVFLLYSVFMVYIAKW